MFPEVGKVDDRKKMIAAMASFGTIGLFVRAIPLPSAGIALLRAVIAVAALVLWRLARRTRVLPAVAGGQLPLLLLSGAAMGFNWIFLFEAYRYTSVSVATLCYSFAPAAVAAVSPLLFRERPALVQVLCFVASTVGLVLIVGSGAAVGAGDLHGILLALAAAGLYAAVILLNKFIRGVQGIDRTLMQFASASAVLLPYVLLTGGLAGGPMTAAGLLCLLAVGLYHSGFCYCLYFSALPRLSGQETAILSYLDPLVAVTLSALVLREHMTPLQMLGGALVLGFTLLGELKGSAPAVSQPE